VDADRLVDTVPNALTDLQILGGVPAAHSFVLEIGV
jgi:hypothetical protein